MNEAQAATPEVLGTEEVTATSDEALLASEENQVVEAKPQDTEVEQGKKPSTFARRMAKFEAAVDSLMQERDYWKQAALETGKQQPAAQEQPKGRLDFGTDEEWVEHRLAQERTKLLQEAQQAASQTLQQDRVIQSYQAKVEATKKDIPDWDTVFNEAQQEGLTLPADTVEFCLDSDVGPKIAYHLAKNPDEYERLISLSPAKRLAQLGKLEDRLAVKPAPVASRNVSQAPAKLVDTKGNASVKTIPAGQERFASKQAWKEWQQAQGKR